MSQNTTLLDQKLTIRQIRVITALVTGASIEEAADQVKVNRASVHRWLRKPDFRDALDLARKDAIRLAFSKLDQAVSEAADKLISLTKSSVESISLRACELILRFAREHVEIGDLLVRIDAIEKRINSPQ